MHIDSGGTNFWLHLLSGRKEWMFFSEKDLVNLYPHGMGEAFDVDPFRMNLTKTPLVKYAQLYTAIQEEGDLIFIPGGNPHGVRNLDDILGISMNYVDVSNIWTHLHAITKREDFRTFEVFTDSIFPHGLRSDQPALTFGEWKSVPWTHIKYDIF